MLIRKVTVLSSFDLKVYISPLNGVIPAKAGNHRKSEYLQTVGMDPRLRGDVSDCVKWQIFKRDEYFTGTFRKSM